MSISQSHVSKTAMTKQLGIFTLCWSMRLLSILLLGYTFFLVWEKHPPLMELCLIEGPLVALCLAGIACSFKAKGNRLLNTISLLVALLGGVLLFNDAVIGDLITTVIAIGLDPLRAQLIASLIMTAGTALLGATLGRRKLGALLGAGIIFWFTYLASFIQLELQPARDPGGNLEPLKSAALVHTSFVMVALALLCAFIGAAVGVALAEVLWNPPYRFGQFLWQRFVDTPADVIATYEGTAQNHSPHASTALNMVGSWLGAVIMLFLLVIAMHSGDLFIFSPDVSLHTAPNIRQHTYHGQRDGQYVSMPTRGTIVQQSMTSVALGGQKKSFLVYLPPSYNTPQGQSRRYPTLYLLHGSPGANHDWFTAGKADQSADTLIALGKIPELILILPDGNGQEATPSEWGNSFDQQQLIETYVVVDLVKYVDQNYRTVAQPAYRSIGGLSMGGFGAMNIAVHHPNVFGTVISLGGYYHAEGSIWGNNAAYIQQNSPANVFPGATLAWKLHIYLGAATSDEPYYTDTKQFAQELDTLHVPYHLDIQNGYHSWSVWQEQMYNALLWLRWK
ncbi:MAG: hypothetical protein NVS4B7_08980 [Ktedonobacteraceae bacterium]